MKFSQKFQSTIVAYGHDGEIKTSIIWKRSDLAKLSEIWDSRVVVQHILYGVTFGLVAFKVILRSLGALSIFHNMGLMIRDRRKHVESL